MREIKFKAKRIDKINWTEGFLTIDVYGNMFIESVKGKTLYSEKVLKHTVSQFTGLTDCNGVEIYEGDKIHRMMGVEWIVKFKDSKWIADGKKPKSGLYLDAYQFIECQVTGNIHDQ